MMDLPLRFYWLRLQDIFVWNVFLENETLPVKWSETNTNCLQFFCWKPDEWVNTLLVTSMKDGKIIHEQVIYDTKGLQN